MKRNPIIAGLLSLIVPGLGQIYAGENNKGGAIIFGAIVIANLNIILLPLISVANPTIPMAAPDSRTIWAYFIPRVVHDVASFWSIAYLGMGGRGCGQAFAAKGNANRLSLKAPSIGQGEGRIIERTASISSSPIV